jgi:hypothetical protein
MKEKTKMIKIEYLKSFDKYYQTSPNTIISDVGSGLTHAKQNWILGATWQPLIMLKNWQSHNLGFKTKRPIEAKMQEQSF